TVIYLRRPDNWLGMLTTGLLIGLSINMVISATISPLDNTVLAFVPYIHALITVYAVFKFLAVFPDGRHIPKWTRWWVYIGMAWEIGRRVFAGAITTAQGEFRLIFFMPTIVLASVGFLAQVIRYRRHSTPNQRQQTKWALLGSALLIVCLALSVGIYFGIVPILESRFNVIWLSIALHIIYYGGFFLLVMGLGFSIVRYRIWEADLAINRSLAYFFITVIIALLFGGILFIIQWLFHILLGQEMDGVATLIAIGVVVSLFPTVQKRVRHVIDKRVFGLRQDLLSLQQQQNQREQIYALGEKGILSDQQIGAYQIGALIGTGGMGHVYHTTHLQTGEHLALKVLSNTLFHEAHAQKRFEYEAKLVKSLQHPHIIPVIDSIIQNNQTYLIMPFIDGHDLSSLYHVMGKFGLAQLQIILSQIAQALDYLHSRGIIHCDIKPSNIMVDKMEHAWLLDFGIAKSIDDTPLSIENSLIGTLHYIAPEQLVSSKDIDHRADIYALGAMTYQLLAGQTPFTGGVGNLVYAHLNQPPPDIRVIMPDMPAQVAFALMRAMA
ncbi:MAG: serine/threonine protein kinase, partial [Anaerolineae bacterium]|nr:serine/threonine protein kinase [Anaerolineae bacterium]